MQSNEMDFLHMLFTPKIPNSQSLNNLFAWSAIFHLFCIQTLISIKLPESSMPFSPIFRSISHSIPVSIRLAEAIFKCICWIYDLVPLYIWWFHVSHFPTVYTGRQSIMNSYTAETIDWIWKYSFLGKCICYRCLEQNH